MVEPTDRERLQIVIDSQQAIHMDLLQKYEEMRMELEATRRNFAQQQQQQGMNQHVNWEYLGNKIAESIKGVQSGVKLLDETVHLKDIIKMVPKFEGTKNGQDSYLRWNKGVSRAQRMYQLDDKLMRFLIYSTVKDTALDFVSRKVNATPDITWVDLLEMMKNRFSDYSEKTLGKQSILGMKQRSGESFAGFSERILLTAQETYDDAEFRSDPVQRTMMEAMIRGMKSQPIAKKLANKMGAEDHTKLTNVDDMLTEAMKYERSDIAFTMLRAGTNGINHNREEPLSTTTEENMEIGMITRANSNTHDERIPTKFRNKLNKLEVEQKATSQGVEHLICRMEELFNQEDSSDSESSDYISSDEEEQEYDTQEEDELEKHEPEGEDQGNMVAYMKQSKRGRDERRFVRFDRQRYPYNRREKYPGIKDRQKYIEYRERRPRERRFEKSRYEQGYKSRDFGRNVRSKSLDDARTTRYNSTTIPKYKPEQSSKYEEKRRTDGKYKKPQSRDYPNRDNNDMKWIGEDPICLFCKKKGHIKRFCAEMRLQESNHRRRNSNSRNFL